MIRPTKLYRTSSPKLVGFTLSLAGLLALTGCSIDYTDSGRPRYAKVYDRTAKYPQGKNKQASQKERRWLHVVEQGESLYSIATGYNRDFRSIAAINDIREPYVISPGQKIYLDRKTYNTLGTNENDPNNQKNEQGAQSKQAQTSKNIDENQYTRPSRWVWPVRGKIVAPFNPKGQLNNGVDIVVKTTTPVRASAAGKVVYQGAGLKGYGKLIIIKHSNEYLSAYAHNDWLLVNEGQWVNQGQQIAYIGQQYEKKFHFQIRKNGKPVDPLIYLPN